jgi:mRNA interferase MazF
MRRGDVVTVAAAPDFRVTIDPSERNGLRVRLQVMADKPVTIRRERIGRQVGNLDDKVIARTLKSVAKTSFV